MKCRVWVEYAVPAALLAAVLYKIVGGAIYDAPRPQIPPDGYLAQEQRVTLGWSRGDHRGPFELQVVAGGDRFSDVDAGRIGAESLVVSRHLDETTYKLPDLAPGKEYCWRVVADEDGLVSCFRTSASFVAFEKNPESSR